MAFNSAYIRFNLIQVYKCRSHLLVEATRPHICLFHLPIYHFYACKCWTGNLEISHYWYLVGFMGTFIQMQFYSSVDRDSSGLWQVLHIFHLLLLCSPWLFTRGFLMENVM